jgi:Rieske Fe-S protein
VGFAVGVVVLLVGLIISWYVTALGAVLALVFGFLWVRDITRESHLAEAPEVTPETSSAVAGDGDREPSYAPDDRYSRSTFLELSTIGVGAVIGGIVTAPALGFMIAPPFLKQGEPDVDIGPITDYPEGKFMVTSFLLEPKQGEVSARTAYVRNNGQLNGKPSFTIISNHCAHLGCPVQPNGPLDPKATKKFADVTIVPTVSIAGFGCPCHGGQYDTEGNRSAGPPVRSLDRYSYSIKNGHVFLGKPFSVGQVIGTGAQATIEKWSQRYPGEPVKGIESWLYPIQPPR